MKKNPIKLANILFCAWISWKMRKNMCESVYTFIFMCNFKYF